MSIVVKMPLAFVRSNEGGNLLVFDGLTFGIASLKTLINDINFIHSGYFYSAFSSPLLLRGIPDYSIDTVSELTRRSPTGNYE